MDVETFYSLPAAEIAKLVRADGPKVCVFPFNGTRRWSLLEHPLERNDSGSAYLDAIIKRHIEICKLAFDLGLDTLLTPCWGPDILARGDEYMQMAAEGLSALSTHTSYLNFFEEYSVRVRFYGDYGKFLKPTRYAYMCDRFAQIEHQTNAYDRRRLFVGLFAHDATETVAEIAVRFYQQFDRAPSKTEIVKAYYGEAVEPVNLFIGFDKCAAFDMPLIATGNEDLYFTVSPSPFMSERQLRGILYDHLYARRGEPDYSAMDAADWAVMRDFYRANPESTIGVGTRHKGIWYPLPQPRLPASFVEAIQKKPR